MRKNRKVTTVNKSLLIILILMALLSETFFGMPAVYAEEVQEGYWKDEMQSVSDNDMEGEDIIVGDNDIDKEDNEFVEDVTDSEEGDWEENNDAAEETDNTVSGNEMSEDATGCAEELLKEEMPETDISGFADMPSDYKLTSFQQELKAKMSDTLGQFKENEEGETFAEDQVITFAESEEEAELIADAYCAEIVNFDMGVLTLNLRHENSVKSALVAAADMDNNLPPVWPNYMRELYEEEESETESDPKHGAENVSTSELEIIEEYEANDVDVEITEGETFASSETYDYVLNEPAVYNDPYLNAADYRYQWFHTAIGSAYAWGAGYTGNGIKVGVIDSGIDSNADLNANIFEKRDFCDGTEDVADYVGHGTHVAGIIAAVADNGSGGAGVAPQAKIFNARVFGKTASKSGYDSTIIGAINYLIGEENNAKSEEICSEPARVDIINMSLGGPGMSGAFQAVLDKAYKKGVVTFAATGNDGGSLMMYPASYNHVIGVAATDKNNERAYFSNYGVSADLAAPGADIWSTLKASYASSQGTSMACPVAAGEAAVILSGKEALSPMKDEQGNHKSGKARVDAVESIMLGNTISAGSGMGKGVTSLPKVFKLSTAVTKPNAPEITVLPDDAKQSVKVTIRVQKGMALCYTTDGRNPVYQNGAAGANTTLINDSEEISFDIDCSMAAKGTIKAIAVNKSGVTSTVKSVSYILRPFVKTITVSGPQRVEQGKSVQLTATVAPAYAVNKSVKWKIENSQGAAVDSAGMKIDQKGKITVAADAEVGDYIVTVQAEDGGKSTAQYSVRVVAAGSALQSLAFDRNTTRELWKTKADTSPTLSLTDFLIAKEKSDGELVVVDNSRLSERVLWASSKPTVATVDNNGIVTAKTAGTTTITVKANDNSNKKASVNITVKQAVTEIEITSDKGKNAIGEYTVAAGKSIALRAGISPDKPANKKVFWSIRPDSSNPSAGPDDMRNIMINRTSGKITVKAGAVSGNYIVTAEAADGKGTSSEQTVKVCGGAIGEVRLDTKKTVLYTKKIDEHKSNAATITATIKGAGGREDFDFNAYSVTSSNPSIVRAEPISNADGTVSIVVTATGGMYGKSNITIASTDGSNKRATCAVTVSGGIKAVKLKNGTGSMAAKVSKLALFRSGTDVKSPKTADIYAVIEGSEGANDKAYEVKSSNPSVAQAVVDKSTGRITVTASGNATGKTTITLQATDGSKKKATCTVTVSNPPSRINIAPKAGTTRYVVAGKSVQLKAVLESEYGAVKDKNVTWSIPDSYRENGITVSKSGKVSLPGWYTKTGVIPVTATAKDGSGVSETYNISVTEPTTYIRAEDPTGSDASGYTIKFYSDCKTSMSCTSSAPGVISPTISYKPSSGSGTIRFAAEKKGTATITIMALDSSGKTCKIVYRVR